MAAVASGGRWKVVVRRGAVGARAVPEMPERKVLWVWLVVGWRDVMGLGDIRT